LDEIYQTIADYDRWFYLITVVWTFFEGESFVVLAGAAAYHGILSLPLIIASAWIGSFAGDQFYFFIGRRYGETLLRRFPRWREGVDTALDWLHQYHVGFILSFRFIYGVRNVSSLACGMSEITWIRFLMLNFIAAGLWATTFACGGYVLVVAFESVLGQIARDVALLMLAAFLVVVWLLVRRHSKRKIHAMHAHPPQDGAGAPASVPRKDGH
jgi:membrane protein DedA with SNARE-associated domain